MSEKLISRSVIKCTPLLVRKKKNISEAMVIWLRDNYILKVIRYQVCGDKFEFYECCVWYWR